MENLEFECGSRAQIHIRASRRIRVGKIPYRFKGLSRRNLIASSQSDRQEPQLDEESNESLAASHVVQRKRLVRPLLLVVIKAIAMFTTRETQAFSSCSRSWSTFVFSSLEKESFGKTKDFCVLARMRTLILNMLKMQFATARVSTCRKLKLSNYLCRSKSRNHPVN